MKTISIKKSGILHRIAQFGGYKEDVHKDDFCAWARRLMLGTFVLLFLIVFVCGFSTLLGMSSLQSYYGDDFTLSVWGFIFVAMPVGLLCLAIGIPALGALCFGVGFFMQNFPTWIKQGVNWLKRRPGSETQTEPSALGSLYAALRGRICAKLHIKD